jgi:hypothetical protein
MDPVALATMVVGVLAPYLTKAGQKIAEKAGEAAWEKASALYDAVRGKTAKDTYAQQTLERLHGAPDDTNRRAAMQAVLAEMIAADTSFAESLHKLLEEDGDTTDEIEQHVRVSGQARTGNITQIGRVTGNIDLGERHKGR